MATSFPLNVDNRDKDEVIRMLEAKIELQELLIQELTDQLENYKECYS